MAETALPNFALCAWLGLLGPAGIPAPILGMLNPATNVALRHPETAELEAHLKREQKRCGAAIEETSGGYFLAYLRGTAKIVVKIPRPRQGVFSQFSHHSFRLDPTGPDGWWPSRTPEIPTKLWLPASFERLSHGKSCVNFRPCFSASKR